MKRAVPAALALTLLAGAAWALTNVQPAGRGCAQMERYLGGWSGSQNCKTGKYGVAFTIERGPQGPTARYQASGGEGGAQGQVRFLAGARPETCEAVAATPVGELRFLVNFAAKGRRLSFRAVSLVMMGAAVPPPGSVSGSADLDKTLARASYRFMSALPMAEDTCGGSLRRSTAP